MVYHEGLGATMHKYEIMLEASRGLPAERVELRADDASVAFCWGEHCAHGRRFEVLEDGRSLGCAALSDGGNFWVLSPAQGRRASRRPQPSEPLTAVLLRE